MFGSERDKRKKKRDIAGDVSTSGADIGDVADGCGCDLPLIALTVMAGASLLYFAR